MMGEGGIGLDGRLWVQPVPHHFGLGGCSQAICNLLSNFCRIVAIWRSLCSSLSLNCSSLSLMAPGFLPVAPPRFLACVIIARDPDDLEMWGNEDLEREMAAPSVTLVGGLRAFDHTVVVEGETILTLALRLASSDRVFFLPCLDTPEREDEAAKPETPVLQRASWLVNKPSLPHLFVDGVVEAEQLIAEVIATPTLSAAEEATLLSSRAAFAELQQEMARNL
ncbi:hypothetical protein H6P81_006718 [Aristolochia fimbriata]|uniref:Uncharacterized protein n=1 Tax=Aristolochia fimbriata TaxID=158543 RepID=A0AAV7EZ92_ARIFI|nr:hypothetical protein H6P81_006718 [Aristolochia fimbriata]